MAYGRRIRRFKRRFRRRFGRKSFVRKVRRVVYNIAEKKYLEYAFSVADFTRKTNLSNTLGSTVLAADWTNQVSLVSTMQQGNAEGQRIGNKVSVKYVQLSLVFLMSNSTGGSNATNAMAANFGSFCRYMVLLDKGPGQSVVPRTYMTSQGSGGNWTNGGVTYTAIPMEVYAFRDFNLMKRVKVLLDMQHKEISMSSTSVGAGVPNTKTGIKVVQHYIPINKTFTYSSQGSATDMHASAAVMSDTDLVLQVSPSDSTCCTVWCAVRLCYTDV